MNAFLVSPWLPCLGWTLIHSLWEGTLVALVAAASLRALQGSSPRFRYAVAVAALAAMVLLPARRLMSGTSSSVEGRAWSVATTVPARTVAPATPSRVSAEARVRLRVEQALPWVVAAWGVGVLLFLLRLAGGWVWLQRLRWRQSELGPDSLQRRLLDLCRRAGLKRAVTLLVTQGIRGPSVVSFLRPAILVPAGWFLNLPADQVEALLAHELAHVLRHDYAVNLLQSMVEVILFYHPGVWWLSRRIRAERELACDAYAVRLTGDTLPLAQALAFLETRGTRRETFEFAPAAHGGSLMERIQHLLAPAPHVPSAPLAGAATILALLLATGLGLQAQTPDPAPQVAPAVPQGNAPGGTALYIKFQNAKDAEGKDIPYSLLFEIKADQVPLNQAWAQFLGLNQTKNARTSGESWSPRDPKVPGPRVNLAMKDATPAEVLAVLNGLARQRGVAAYEPPAPAELPVFSIRKYVRRDGSTVFDFHARQVSAPFLHTLVDSAKRMAADSGVHDRTYTFERACDSGKGPRLDALFEGVTLEELDVRVQRLVREGY